MPMPGGEDSSRNRFGSRWWRAVGSSLAPRQLISGCHCWRYCWEAPVACTLRGLLLSQKVQFPARPLRPHSEDLGVHPPSAGRLRRVDTGAGLTIHGALQLGFLDAWFTTLERGFGPRLSCFSRSHEAWLTDRARDGRVRRINEAWGLRRWCLPY